jgi:hypothetical protein
MTPRLPGRHVLADVDTPQVGRAARVEEGERALDRDPRGHPGPELLGLLAEVSGLGRVPVLLFLVRQPLGLLDRPDFNGPPEIGEADPAEDQDEDRDDRHEPDHPAPDQLDPPHRLRDDRVDRLLLDVRRQAERGQEGHHDRQQERAQEHQGADVQTTHLGGSGGREEPVGEGEHDEEDHQDDPDGPHPPIRLEDAHLGDRVEPPEANRGDLAEDQGQDLQEHHIAHVRRAQAGAVDQPLLPGRLARRSPRRLDHARLLKCEPDSQAQEQPEVDADQDEQVARAAKPTNRGPESPFHPEEKDHGTEQPEQEGEGLAPHLERIDPLGRFQDIDQEAADAAEQRGQRGVIEPATPEDDPLLDRGREPGPDPGDQADEADHLEPGDQAAEDPALSEAEFTEDKKPGQDSLHDRVERWLAWSGCLTPEQGKR